MPPAKGFLLLTEKKWHIGPYAVPDRVIFLPGTTYRRLFCGMGTFSGSARVALRPSSTSIFKAFAFILIVFFCGLVHFSFSGKPDSNQGGVYGSPNTISADN